MSEKNNNGEIKELSFRDVIRPFFEEYFDLFKEAFTNANPETRRIAVALVDPLISVGGVHFKGAVEPVDLGKKLWAASLYLKSFNNGEADRHAKNLDLVTFAIAGFTVYAKAAVDLAREQQQNLPVGHC